MFKKTVFFTLILFSAFCILSGCSKKEGTKSFDDLKSGMTKEEIASVMGTGYEETIAPIRIIYTNIPLIDSVTTGKETKLSCFFASDKKCYMYAYYIYSGAEADYLKIKEVLTQKYGESAPGENEATIQWTEGNTTVTLTDAGDYIAVGKY